MKAIDRKGEASLAWARSLRRRIGSGTQDFLDFIHYLAMPGPGVASVRWDDAAAFAIASVARRSRFLTWSEWDVFPECVCVDVRRLHSAFLVDLVQGLGRVRFGRSLESSYAFDAMCSLFARGVIECRRRKLLAVLRRPGVRVFARKATRWLSKVGARRRLLARKLERALGSPADGGWHG